MDAANVARPVQVAEDRKERGGHVRGPQVAVVAPEGGEHRAHAQSQQPLALEAEVL